MIRHGLHGFPYGVFYACADVVTGQDEKVKLFGSLEIPAIVFKLWWIIPVCIFTFTTGMLQ